MNTNLYQRKSFSLLLLLLCATLRPGAASAFPNVCTVVNSSSFGSCLGLKISNAMCGWPVPRPCARITYYVPETFIEVVSNPKETYFSDLPGTAMQLATTSGSIPFGVEDDEGAYSYQAHALKDKAFKRYFAERVGQIIMLA